MKAIYHMNKTISNKIYEIFQKVANLAVESPLIRIPCTSLEPKRVSLEGWEEARPIFIIGPPRSGTTALYQLLTNKFYFSYINRLMNLFYYSPLLMAKISHLLAGFSKKKTNMKSYYGKVSGMLSPDEGNLYWNHLLPEINDTDYIPKGSCSEQQIYEIRRLVQGLHYIVEQPFLSKKPSNAVRLAPLNEAFPRALYIVIFRDPVYNAQSLYIARHKRKVDKHGWCACKPKEYPAICHYDSILQSVCQVYYILKQIEEDKGLFENRMVELRYEDLCEKPAMNLDLIANFFAQHGIKVMENESFGIPAMHKGNVRNIEERLFNRIKTEVDRIFNGWEPIFKQESTSSRN